ncbi:conserved oligomeric Golgi complex subunit 3 [Anthonomus grandis grandis]|uniref:conserved oligomeric Golgi complex subunit 3 n=1 Tax=Anthonomus grandis grandis TaxID=2921223 RepID=UPI002166282E|nr:conserved oligomeric Golgi complex subunit 3 [Anthonomus grandis grandis]
MATSKHVPEDLRDKQIQENIASWQSTDDPLAPLDAEQTELIYELGDLVKSLYDKEEVPENDDTLPTEKKPPPIINNNKDFIQWMISVEKEIQHEDLKDFQEYYDGLSRHLEKCELLFGHSEYTVNSISKLKETYENVIDKTNYLHNLSEQLMVQQNILKEKKTDINSKLKYFLYLPSCQELVEHLGHHKVNSKEFIEVLNNIDEAIDYLGKNLNFKESKLYKMKYESLMVKALSYVYDYVNYILSDTIKQVTNTDIKPTQTIQAGDSIFSLYYGKFQSVSVKVKLILDFIETSIDSKDDINNYYKNTLYDCQKSYFTQRLPILEAAVSKSLHELKEKQPNDYSVLFRSCCLFTIKVCMDEARCYNYFFKSSSDQLNDYLGCLCQYLYDTLRPCLIVINHIEILSELCSILKNEMLNDRVTADNSQEGNNLSKYVEVIRQLLEDVEERLVFRTNVYFKHDLNDYRPSPGDLAYPEKLQQMENIILDLKRPDSRGSVVSLESQEVAQINTSSTHLRSYTGNSPADLHGMWYPTVKRTLVCLSRLYYCLDRDTFQSLAQEALIVCVRTVQHASDMISNKKTPVDGKLFEIKHLLIIREQIAPFQVDFTTKELSLDFSNVQKAALGLLHKRKQIFSFSSNNALLEFLLEGTPKVKEYLVDSRKEIDKQLKHSCESFIACVTKLLIGNVLDWIEKAEKILKIIKVENTTANDLTVKSQSFGKPEYVAGIIKDTQKSIKTHIPEVQRSMQLYLANRETEFILFRPIKNNIINAFMQIDQILIKGGYSTEDQLLIACPSPEQVNILICSVSLTIEHEPLNN